jgi:hypothetical protein
LREVWIEARLALIFETPDLSTAQSLADSFRAPAFPITAGTSDALLKAVAVRVESAEPVATRSLTHTLIFREILPNYELYGSIAEIPLHRTIRAPTVERLPTGFRFEPDGRRHLQSRGIVSFVGDAINLHTSDEPVVGYEVTPHSSFLRNSPPFSAWKGKLPWTIPVHRYDSLPMREEDSSTTPSPSEKTSRKGRKSNPTGST